MATILPFLVAVAASNSVLTAGLWSKTYHDVISPDIDELGDGVKDKLTILTDCPVHTYCDAGYALKTAECGTIEFEKEIWYAFPKPDHVPEEYLGGVAIAFGSSPRLYNINPVKKSANGSYDCGAYTDLSRWTYYNTAGYVTWWE